MTCYHPNRVFTIGYNPDGSPVRKFGGQADYLIQTCNGFTAVSGSKPIVSPDGLAYHSFDGRSSVSARAITDFVYVPCGQCIGCRLDHSREWANRMMMELQDPANVFNWFLTLTYDDDHLPLSGFEDDAGLHITYSLSKSDLQRFLKRLRKHFTGTRIRYYACGEYGSTTYRPHYHLILYNVPLVDLKYRQHVDGCNYYTSDTISALWPDGFHLLTDVTWDTCAYTARYVTKKFKGQAAHVYDDLGIVPEFSTMSLKPGLGYWYFENHLDEIYAHDHFYLSSPRGSISCRSPAYFDKLYDVEHHDELMALKSHRLSLAEHAQQLLEAQTSLPYLEALAAKEEVFKSKAKIALNAKNSRFNRKEVNL